MTESAPEVATEPLRPAEELGEPRPSVHAGMTTMMLGALGVVFGDIGTSPLYALQTVFAVPAVRPDEAGVYGVVSLVFWTITLIVSVKFVLLIMRADNHGEGGIMALVALVRGVEVRSRHRTFLLIALGIFGASLFYGDGMITPAISVLSAVEGLEVAAPAVSSYVVPITLAILTALFAVQRFGTSKVARAFGPVMAVWFTILGVSGLVHVVANPGVLRSLSPVYGAAFLVDHVGIALPALGAIVLTVTGAEALYADMGHFGVTPIRRAWFAIVFPALVLNYMGQGAIVLSDPQAIANPFFLMFPGWAHIPMVLLATVAAVIASQAVISGAFSVTRQAVQMGFLPRLTVLHTGSDVGQVYVPAVNWLLFVAVAGLVVGFGSSQSLAGAYGIAVTGTLAIDTLLFFFVARALWHRPLWLVVTGAVFFLTIDLAFFGANIPKVLHGGWFPLLVAVLVFVLLSTWQRGRQIVARNRTKIEGPLDEFVAEVRGSDGVFRAPHTGVYLNANADTTPLALRENLRHNDTVHENVLILSVQTIDVPHVRESKRFVVDEMDYRDDGIYQITARFGFQDYIDVPAVLARSVEQMEVDVDLDHASYFVSRTTVVATRAPGMRRWRKRLFVIVLRNAADPVRYFRLPDDRTAVMGAHIEL
ncbi:MAG TPA: potassium transporter Kup [Nocardioidaceae bacterium]|nr:potassium transporter Kup [Nocardioidaceae bacterium]